MFLISNTRRQIRSLKTTLRLVPALLLDFRCLLITFIFLAVWLLLVLSCFPSGELSLILAHDYAVIHRQCLQYKATGSRGRLRLIPIRLSNAPSHHGCTRLIFQLHFFWKIPAPCFEETSLSAARQIRQLERTSKFWFSPSRFLRCHGRALPVK